MASIPSIRKSNGAHPRKRLPQFVHVRQIKSDKAHYWVQPTRDRKLPDCPKPVPLGSNWAAVVERAAALNKRYNVWRLQRVK
jgi:hypothetical protein